MSFTVFVAVTLVSALLLLKLLTKGQRPKNLPGGSMGFPFIGETLSFLQAQKEERGSEWIDERVLKHGSVFKTSILGSPTVVIVGLAGNKFVLGSNEDVLVAQQPKTLSAITGKNNILELTGPRYKLIKGAMMSFLKPESLQNYTKRMDETIKALLLKETKEKDSIKAVEFMKKLTYNIACNVLFDIQDELTRDAMIDDFTTALKAVWSLPLNFPGTMYWRGLRARSRIVQRITPIMEKRKEKLSKGILNPMNDVMSCMLAVRDQNPQLITDESVMDNFVTLMIASHDTTAILLTLMVWKLGKDPKLYHKILEEQMEIVRKREGKEDGLTWGEIQKMKYTWRVAQELMRIIPPVFGTFRKSVADTSYGGYDIPKGWLVNLID